MGLQDAQANAFVARLPNMLVKMSIMHAVYGEFSFASRRNETFEAHPLVCRPPRFPRLGSDGLPSGFDPVSWAKKKKDLAQVYETQSDLNFFAFQILQDSSMALPLFHLFGICCSRQSFVSHSQVSRVLTLFLSLVRRASSSFLSSSVFEPTTRSSEHLQTSSSRPKTERPQMLLRR